MKRSEVARILIHVSDKIDAMQKSMSVHAESRDLFVADFREVWLDVMNTLRCDLLACIEAIHPPAGEYAKVAADDRRDIQGVVFDACYSGGIERCVKTIRSAIVDVPLSPSEQAEMNGAIFALIEIAESMTSEDTPERDGWVDYGMPEFDDDE